MLCTDFFSDVRTQFGPALQAAHPHFVGSDPWHLTENGILSQSQCPTSKAGRQLIASILDRYERPLRAAGTEYGVPGELVLATVATQSSARPLAVRQEPGYTSDEATPHKVSVGLMQTLISTAGGALGRNDRHRPRLAARAG